MSIFSEFHKAWKARFPGHELPTAWEEDVRSNLAKHRARETLLREELEKEQFYVDYLERLLEDVKRHRLDPTQRPEEERGRGEGRDTESLVSEAINSAIGQDKRSVLGAPEVSDEPCSPPPGSTVKDLARKFSPSFPAPGSPSFFRSVSAPAPDADEFVTVIPINGSIRGKRNPPPPPPKTFKRPVSSGVELRPDASPKIRPRAPLPAAIPKVPRPKLELPNLSKTPSSVSSGTTGSNISNSNLSSSSSSSPALPASNESLDNFSDDEPIYDTVAPDEDPEYGTVKSVSSDGVTDSTRSISPSDKSNYVNLDFFLKAEKSEDENEEKPSLLSTISSDPEELKEISLEIYSGVYDDTSGDSVPSDTKETNEERQKEATVEEAQRLTMYKCILSSILESESVYVECLTVVLQYMKALKATLTTSQPVISPDDFSTVFYRIPELHAAHNRFLQGLKQRNQNDGSVGRLFKHLASRLDIYAQFLQNYQRAVETVRRCSSNNQQFSDITRSIKLRNLQGQAQSLEELLHRPVARVQKNALVLHDLLKFTTEHDSDYDHIREALNLTQNFLTNLSMRQTEAVFQQQERPQRHLVRNSFIVELVDGQRKLRHLFLFNDVLVCAKYKATGKTEKFTFEVKWYISLHDIIIVSENIFDTVKESSPPNLIALKSQASNVRNQLKRQESLTDNKGGVNKINASRSEKRKKKLAELEAQLILASPNLPLRIGKRAGLTYTFLLTSEYERDQWAEAIKTLQANTPGVGGSSLTMAELQTWITAYRSFLKTNMGCLLQSSNHSLLIGDLHVVVSSLHGLTSPSHMFLCFEVDSYGHFFRKAKTKISEGIEPVWNEDFVIDLEGTQILRILCYEKHRTEGVVLRGKAHLELSRSWLSGTLIERRVSLQDLVLVLSLKFLPPEATLRFRPGKAGLFGAALSHVCVREKRSVPFIVTKCVREVERRGLSEVGVYRISGLASDINNVKKSFETNPYEAEQLVKEIDIHAVTGLLKLYLRELPEALFTDELYPRFFDAFSSRDLDYRRITLLKLFTLLPQLNQSLIVYVLEHLVKINKQECLNKMSLHNLATVFGPTMLRPIKMKVATQEEQLTASTVDVMAQAGILHFFLKRRAHGEPIQVANP